MDNKMKSISDRQLGRGNGTANGHRDAPDSPRPDRRLISTRWRYLTLMMLNTLISLMLLTNLFVTDFPAPVTPLQEQAARAYDEEEILTRLYENVGPAVVKIVVAQHGQVDLTHPESQGHGVGSGIIVDHQGHIVTNHHVVDKAADVVVKLTSGRVVRAAVVGLDPVTDLALLRIEVPIEDLTVAPFANSDSLRVGQIAIVIGYPFGLDQSLTVGHISGLGREVPTQDEYIPVIEGMIQTDAAINPGNSGGPLLNLQGEVVGINTAILSTSQGSQGVGFALPSNTARQVIAELLDKGYVSRPFLGVVGLPLDPERAESLGLVIDHGLLIQKVDRGSPAWRAGLRVGSQSVPLGRWLVRVGGDVLVAIDDQPVDSMETLSKIVQGRAIGDPITLRLHRVDQEIELVVTLSERPASVW